MGFKMLIFNYTNNFFFERGVYFVKHMLHTIFITFFCFYLSGTGTFGRVCLCRDKAAEEFLAMKILAMADVIRLKQVEHVKNEKNILSEVNHPFIVNL